jgi:hypothetical protein
MSPQKPLHDMTHEELETLIETILSKKMANFVASPTPLTDEAWEMFMQVIPSTPSTRPSVLLQQERDQWYKPTS